METFENVCSDSGPASNSTVDDDSSKEGIEAVKLKRRAPWQEGLSLSRLLDDTDTMPESDLPINSSSTLRILNLSHNNVSFTVKLYYVASVDDCSRYVLR